MLATARLTYLHVHPSTLFVGVMTMRKTLGMVQCRLCLRVSSNTGLSVGPRNIAFSAPDGKKYTYTVMTFRSVKFSRFQAEWMYLFKLYYDNKVIKIY